MTEYEVEVYRGAGGELEQAFYESALREAGIGFVTKSEGVSQHPVSIGPMSSFAIFVGPADETKARDVVSDLQKVRGPNDDGESDDEEAPRLTLGIGKRSERDKKAFLALGAALVVASLYLLIPYRDASLFGILLLVPAALFLAGSR